ncbi:MAG: peptide chain release factor N(5)-glutamine methyltransferase [Gemmataceae bacterium]
MPDWTIRALMEWTEQHFQQKGLESPRLEAQLLLAHALTCKRVELYTRWDEPVAEGPRGQFRELVKRRLDGCPAMYLTGRREFYALEFEVTPAVLIPRPETELVVTETLNRIKSLPGPRVLDVGTGSGCIAIAIAQRNKSAIVTAIDLSADALDVAKRNAARHGLAERIRFLAGDLLAPLPADERFDVIVSNPPYISQPELAALPRHVRDFEPRIALDGGPDGFAVYDRLIPAAVERLAPGGHLLLEIGATRDEGVRRRIVAAGLEPGPTLRDDAKLPRVVTARRKSG